MPKEQAMMLFAKGQTLVVARRFRDACKSFVSALAIMETELDYTSAEDMVALADAYETASYSAYSVYNAGRPRHQTDWCIEGNRLTERSVELVELAIVKLEKAGPLQIRLRVSQGLRLIRLAGECVRAKQFATSAKYSQLALSNDAKVAVLTRHHLLRVEQRLLLHARLAEACAGQGAHNRALVVIDDGLGLHKPNEWYHHVDAVFLERRSIEMEQYSKLCLLKAQLLKQQSKHRHN